MNFILLQASTGGFPGQLILFGGIILVFYFFMIRPQQKKQKDLQKFRESLKAGSQVVTSGGIHGKILAVREDSVDLEVDRGIKIKVDKSSITHEAVAKEQN